MTWKPYAVADSAWQTLGTIPVTAAELPAVPLRLRLDKSGYAPIEVAAPGRHYRFTLTPEADLSPGIVRVPAGNLRVNYGGIGELTGAIGIGYSMGSEVAPMLLSMDRRFAAAALLSGGLTPFFGKLPEVNAVNFLPRVRTPVLMVNGKYDSILPAATAQEPMFQQLGTPPADKRRIVVDSGHTVMTPETQNALIKAVLDWFDKYL